MATIQCRECGNTYNDDPNLYLDGEVYCPHCGLYADGSKRAAHYPVQKIGTFEIVFTVVLCLPTIFFLYMGIDTSPDTGWLFFTVLGLLATILPIAAVYAYTDAYKMYELSRTDPKAFQELMNERDKKEAQNKEAMAKIKAEEERRKYNYYKYKCPMCGSNRIVNLSTVKKAVSAEAFGLGSKTVGKCYRCDDCKYIW